MWDVLYQRYGNPTMLLDQMIQVGRLSEFISEVVKIQNEETKDKTLWEFFLHKVHDRTYGEYLKEMDSDNQEPETADMEQVEATVKNSMNILNNFNMQ